MSGPLKTLFLSSCVRGGGAGYSLYYLLKHLDRSVIDPLVVVPDQGIFAERFAQLGLTVLTPRHFPERTAQQRFSKHNRATAALSYAWNLGDSAWLVPELTRIIKQHGVELVYCNNMMVKPLGAPAAQLADVPAVLHVRNLHERPFAIALYCQTVGRLPAVQLVIANSAASAVPYQRAVPEKVVVVHNGIDLEEYAPAAGNTAPALRGGAGGLPAVPWRERIGAAPEDVLIGFTGNLIPRKGVDVLIRAFARVQARRPQLQLLVAGRVPIGSPTDYGERYRELARSLGVGARVHFLGFVADVRPLVRALDVLVLPSLQEPFGRSIIEAMALGTPVVASRVGGIPEVLDDGLDGLLVPPADDLALSHALERLVASPELRAQLAARAEQKVRERFDVHVLTQQMQQLLLQAAGRVPAERTGEPAAEAKPG